MDDSTRSASADRVVDLLERDARDEALERLETVQSATAEDRKATVRSLRAVAEDRPVLVGEVCAALTSFLDDEERSIRLTAAKLFVAVAEATPNAVVPAVPSLADRLGDEREFYYVRARCAEALGYVALDRPEEVSDPATLAELRVGLSFDESEVREKLAKALACVALGDPSRLRHQVASLAGHLTDDRELVRYHLCTALVVVGCEHPERLSESEAAFRARLTDENESPYVRGRAAEALALLVRDGTAVEPVSELDPGAFEDDEAPAFLTDRVRFLRRLQTGKRTAGVPDGVGTVEAVRAGAASVADDIASPDGDGECPNCGLALPAEGPPMCPRCGAPR
jgi:hypothetical protein